MHSYFLSAAAVFICMCKRVRVCLPVCLVRPCVYLFMNSDGVFVCTVPLFQQKMRRHLLGDSELAVKKRERKCGGRRRKKKRKEKKNPGSPEIYLFWLPASLKLPVGDFKMAPLPATEWALPCQNVFEWKTQAEKFPPFLSLPRCFFPLLLPCSLFLHFPTPLLSILQRAQKGHLIFSSGAPLECCLFSLSVCLSLSLSLEHCQSSLSQWGICQSLRSPFFTKTWCLSPGSCLWDGAGLGTFVRSDYDLCKLTELQIKSKWIKLMSSGHLTTDVAEI